ncbi:hypothetical protein SH449x_002280 [Pirellulaceae bacterium SH449]
MKKIIRVSLAVLSVVAFTADFAMAQRGRGGGGRAGGGMSRGGGFSGGSMASRPSPAISRSPSMSRPSPGYSAGGVRPGAGAPGAGARPGGGTGAPGVGTRPGTGAPVAGARPGGGIGAPGAGTRPGVGAGAGGRPSAGDLQGFLNLGPSTGAIGAGRPGGANLGAAGGGAAAAFLQGGGVAGRPSAGQLPAAGERGSRGENQAARSENRAGNQATRSENRASNQAGRAENRQQLQDNRGQRADELRNQVLDNHPRLDFWSQYPNWAAMRITRPYRWATWGAVTGWVGYGASAPVSYNYGDSVYYEGDTVYQDGQPIASSEEYTQQAETIVASAPAVASADADWLPLGVFALSPDGQSSGPTPSLFLQLAISKEGVIRGTLNNTATGKTQDVEGMVDKKSQRCAWTVAGQSRPIMETGISNLTQDTAPSLIHFNDGQTQQWLMVRLEEPKTPQ